MLGLGRRQFTTTLTVLTVAMMFIAIRPLSAAPREPGAFIEDLGNRAIKLLSDKNTSPAQQKMRFRELLREGFATRAIGYFVIGKYRRTSNVKTVDEFVDTFEDYIVELYSTQFRHYSGERFEILRVVKTNRPHDSIVETNIIKPDSDKTFKVNFQVRHKDGKPLKILDVKIEGVSMILAQRDEFIAYISQNGGELNTLIEKLKSRIATLKNDNAKDTRLGDEGKSENEAFDRSNRRSGDRDNG